MWLQVSLVVVGLFGVLVFVSWLAAGKVIGAFHKHNQEWEYATQYSQVLAFSLPGRIIQQQLTMYLQAQCVLFPSVVVSILSVALNIVASLVLVFGYGVSDWSGMGFIGCPIVTTATQTTAALGTAVAFPFVTPGVDAVCVCLCVCVCACVFCSDGDGVLPVAKGACAHVAAGIPS